MCWLPIDQPLPLPGDSMICAQGASPCSGTQSLASRLRKIGDEMEKHWTVGSRDNRYYEKLELNRKVHFKGFVWTAIQITVLMLFIRKRHL